MKLTPTPFASSTTPFRVVLPARFSPDGKKRKTHYFKNLKEAKQFAKKVNDYGLAAIGDSAPAMPQTERDQWETAIRWALKELNGDFREIYNAVGHYKLTRLNVKHATLREAFEAFMAFRRNDGLSSRTIETNRGHLVKLFDHGLEHVQISEITKVQLIEFFDTITKGSLKSVDKSVRKFFNWCQERNFIGENPFATIKCKGIYGVNNDFYPVETFKRMLGIAAGLEPAHPGEEPTRDFLGLLPWFILSGFAGLRSAEAFRYNLESDAVKWTDLYFEGCEHPHLDIRKEVSKGKKKRRPVDMAPALEALQAWLPLCQQNGPWIVQWTSRKIQDLKSQFEQRTGIKFLENGFRNSFATYALSYSTLSGLGHISQQMGNSEHICERHYVQSLPRGSGKGWFDLRPYTANVIPMPAVA